MKGKSIIGSVHLRKEAKLSKKKDIGLQREKEIIILALGFGNPAVPTRS